MVSQKSRPTTFNIKHIGKYGSFAENTCTGNFLEFYKLKKLIFGNYIKTLIVITVVQKEVGL